MAPVPFRCPTARPPATRAAEWKSKPESICCPRRNAARAIFGPLCPRALSTAGRSPSPLIRVGASRPKPSTMSLTLPWPEHLGRRQGQSGAEPLDPWSEPQGAAEVRFTRVWGIAPALVPSCPVALDGRRTAPRLGQNRVPRRCRLPVGVVGARPRTGTIVYNVVDGLQRAWLSHPSDGRSTGWILRRGPVHAWRPEPLRPG